MDHLHIVYTIPGLVAAVGDPGECVTAPWRHEVPLFTPSVLLFTPSSLPRVEKLDVPFAHRLLGVHHRTPDHGMEPLLLHAMVKTDLKKLKPFGRERYITSKSQHEQAGGLYG